MDDKNGLYIVAVVGIVAVVALIILATGSLSPRATDSGNAAADQAGQAMAVAGKCTYQCQPICHLTFYCNNQTNGNATRCYTTQTCSQVCGTVCGSLNVTKAY